ncbi:MAG TPA: hypothetical protein VH255_04665, partial [Verrucomicrobiae bacterium]|nr:hypothetical protein [Verrucomicrobiae bacterium]
PVLLTWTLIGVSLGYGILILWLILWSITNRRRIGLAETANGSRPIVRSYEYRSSLTLLGLPLVHIRFGGETGKSLPAKGWIACGNIAYGILFASGGVAVGAVSMGGVAIGGLAIGGCSLGLLGFGGIAIGYFVVGGVALGYLACGGAAIAWLTACGGAAVAHTFALGGATLAQHANDETARAFVKDNALLAHAYLFMNLAILLSCLSLVPGLLYFRKQSRQQRTAR